MKIWKRIIEARLRDSVQISKTQYRFIPGKVTTDTMFALRMFMEKYSKKSERGTLCILGPSESLRQGFKRKAVVLYEKIRNS